MTDKGIVDGKECRYWFRLRPGDYRKCSLRGENDNCDEIKDCFVKELLGKLVLKEQALVDIKEIVEHFCNACQEHEPEKEAGIVCTAIMVKYYKKSKNAREPMNNFEKLRDCKSISEMASFLAFTDLAEIIEIEQIIPDELFYKEWLGKEVEE